MSKSTNSAGKELMSAVRQVKYDRHLSTEERLNKLNSIYDTLLEWLFDCAVNQKGKGTGAAAYVLEKIRSEISALGGELKDDKEIHITFDLELPIKEGKPLDEAI